MKFGAILVPICGTVKSTCYIEELCHCIFCAFFLTNPFSFSFQDIILQYIGVFTTAIFGLLLGLVIPVAGRQA
jgi:hypothetical protein